MTEPRVLLATLVLNEMEWLPRLYAQHKNWPGLVRWVFVEAADRMYARANPDMVSAAGLSTDGTTEFLASLARLDPRVEHVRHGLAGGADVAQGKAEARDRYCRSADEVGPELIVQLDADEFYTAAHQSYTNVLFKALPPDQTGMCLRQREIWRPPALAAAPLLSMEVVGGLWKMTHCHCWRYVRGMGYLQTHIWPQAPNGYLMNGRMTRWDHVADTPVYVHLGWASLAQTRLAKIGYYRARGEGQGDKRQKWMECREAWAAWRPGVTLPHGAEVIPYTGPVPEVLK